MVENTKQASNKQPHFEYISIRALFTDTSSLKQDLTILAYNTPLSHFEYIVVKALFIGVSDAKPDLMAMP
ncbi:hypothetical protein V2J09_013317 [Rumex salicifolius]